MRLRILFMVFVFFLVSCRQKSASISAEEDFDQAVTSNKILPEQAGDDPIVDYDSNQWMEIITEESDIVLDIRYATNNNFTKKQIYECGRCFLRPEAAKKLISLNQGIKKKYGLQFKVFDCYRPRPAQQNLWDIVPDARYVTPPERGSMHNRGMAIDITLVDQSGKELDMGTGYDFFGRAAHTDHNDLPAEVLNNRRLLQTMMSEIGFKTIRTEWWHFSYQGPLQELSSWEWACNLSI